jgi:6-phosphogluconolactonase
MTEPSPPPVEWLQLADDAAVRRTALQRIVAAAQHAQQQRGVFHIALAGGQTPRRLYEAWRQRADFDWQRTEVFWGDERAVAADDPHSNYRMAHEALLRHVPIPAAHVHRMRAEMADLDAAAWEYEAQLRGRLGEEGRLDLMLLGLGTDAHTASLFPGAAALAETQRWVVPTPAPAIAPRLTGTAVWFNATRAALFLVVGADKRQAVSRIRSAADSPQQLPARLIAPRQGTVTWLLDRQAGNPSPALP